MTVYRNVEQGKDNLFKSILILTNNHVFKKAL